MIIMSCKKCKGKVEMHEAMVQRGYCGKCCPDGPAKRVTVASLMQDPEYAAMAAILDEQMGVGSLGPEALARWHEDRHSIIELSRQLV